MATAYLQVDTTKRDWGNVLFKLEMLADEKVAVEVVEVKEDEPDLGAVTVILALVGETFSDLQSIREHVREALSRIWGIIRYAFSEALDPRPA